MAIKLLDENTANKIAAGEVIENPSNVVKELVENSIDSGASHITIEIKGGGIDYIKIIDDGIGFEKNDIKTAFLQHATSKLNRIDDLMSLHTFGFRGEALASIASVADVTLITKSQNEIKNNGYKYEICCGNDNELVEVASNVGSTIIISNLFRNVPVRRKFLKGPGKESAYIEDIVYKFALAKPEISFTLIVDDRQKFKSSGDGNQKNILYSLYGKDIFDRLIDVDDVFDGIKVKGFIARPEVARNTRNDEIYFVNDRFVKNITITKAIEAAYENYLMQHKFPLVSLNISLDKNLVDVNIHPRKAEVRFSNDDKIYLAIYNILTGALKKEELIHIEKFDNDQNVNEAFEESLYEKKDIDSLPSLKSIVDNKVEDSAFNINYEVKTVEHPFIEKSLSEDHHYIGQVFNTYILVEFDEKLYIIDQHAAHEKINFETLMNDFKNGKLMSYKILPSIVLKLTPIQYEAVMSNIDSFAKIGFEIEPFGDNDIKVDAVPYNIYNIGNTKLLMDMIDSFASGNVKEQYDSVIEKIASMSCKAAIKANHKLNEIEVKELLRNLFKLENPYNCPHGRPTIISLSKTEFEKKFGRIV